MNIYTICLLNFSISLLMSINLFYFYNLYKMLSDIYSSIFSYLGLFHAIPSLAMKTRQFKLIEIRNHDNIADN